MTENTENTENTIIGKCFVTIGEDGKVDRQGVVRHHVYGSLYMVQYFDWLMGAPNIMEVIDFSGLARSFPKGSAKEPNNVLFFMDDKHMRSCLEDGFLKHLMH